MGLTDVPGRWRRRLRHLRLRMMKYLTRERKELFPLLMKRFKDEELKGIFEDYVAFYQPSELRLTG